MSGQMCWLSQTIGQDADKILYLKPTGAIAFRPYTAFPQYSVRDYPIPRGSKGWATYQKLLKCGWSLVSSVSGESERLEQTSLDLA